MQQVSRLRRDPVIAQREVDEAGPADLDVAQHLGGGQVAGEFGGNVARRAMQALAQGQRNIRLEVGELRRPDQRVSPGVVRAERRAKRVADQAGEDLLRIGHAPRLSAALAGSPVLGQGRRRKCPPRAAPSRSLIFSVIWPLASPAASTQAEEMPRAVAAPCAITTFPSSPSSAAPP